MIAHIPGKGKFAGKLGSLRVRTDDGREFSLGLIESVLGHESSPIRVDNLTTRLAVLVDSGLLLEKVHTAPHEGLIP